MTPVRRVADGPAGRDEAVRVLAAGGIVALPTDTVYGIAVAPSTPNGLERLFAAKSRPPDRQIALLVANAEQADEIGELPPAGVALATAFWPGGLTLVVARRHGTNDDPETPATVGLRVPDHEAPRALAAALGPLPTTSANRFGEPEARDADEIEAILGDAVDLILDGGRARGGPASTVVDVTVEPPRILRVGAVGTDAIVACLSAGRLPGPPGVGR